MSPATSRAQTDTTSLNKKKLRTLLITSGVAYAGGIATLNHIWYSNNDRQSFRFFNDNAEWKQCDKAGHVLSSYVLSDLSSTLLRGAGVPPKKSDVYGALTGLMLTLPIEVLDGYSSGYGASVGDAVADAAGSALFLGQKLLWREIRVQPKFSFHRTRFAPLRPELLGDNLLSEIVKDYNGQTYWLSLDIDKFTTFPKWLNFAVGYGAEEMVYARDHENTAAGFIPFRQFYVAVDIDLSSIQTRSKALKMLLYVINIVRLPAPALEFSPRGSRFHAFYF